MEEQSLENPNNKRICVSKIFSIISFIIVFTLLALAIVLDIVIFHQVLLQFIGGIIISVLFFLLCVIGFAASFILIFGFYLVNQYGFWPINVAISLFKEIMGDIVISPDQIHAFSTGRIALIVACLVVSALSIASLIIKKRAKKDGYIGKTTLITSFDIVAIIFSSLGIITSVIMLLLISII